MVLPNSGKLKILRRYKETKTQVMVLDKNFLKFLFSPDCFIPTKLNTKNILCSGSGPWSGNWSDAFQFSTAGPPPDEAPSNVVIHVKDKRVTAKWKGIGRGQPDNPLKGYYVSLSLQSIK